MAKIPEKENKLVAAIDAAHERKSQGTRYHLGVSMAGHPCQRYMWISFRWAVIEKFPGRILRLFRRGQNEEETIVSDLRSAGLVVRDVDANGRQFRVDFGEHVSGSMDGIIESGVPEAPKKPHILEAKTHSLKSFKELLKAGSVEASKPLHWVQMQLYMHGKGIDRALYYAVCKDDDSIYTERVRYSKEVAEYYVTRAQNIATSDRMPEPLSADPSWYQCKFCPAHEVCHDTHLTKEVNCRTCAHSTACSDNTWHCARWDSTIPHKAQIAGCDDHVLHPDLVPWQLAGGDGVAADYLIDGKPVRNGHGGFKSRELLANPKACTDGDVQAVRLMFDAEVVG